MGPHEVLFTEWIMDPDHDDVQYNVTLDNEEIMDLYVGDNGVILTPIQIGVVNVTISAIDENGAKLTGNFAITVKNRTGIDDLLSGGLEIYQIRLVN